MYTYEHFVWPACKLNDLFMSCYESSFLFSIDELQTFFNCPKVTAARKYNGGRYFRNSTVRHFIGFLQRSFVTKFKKRHGLFAEFLSSVILQWSLKNRQFMLCFYDQFLTQGKISYSIQFPTYDKISYYAQFGAGKFILRPSKGVGCPSSLKRLYSSHKKATSKRNFSIENWISKKPNCILIQRNRNKTIALCEVTGKNKQIRYARQTWQLRALTGMDKYRQSSPVYSPFFLLL